MKAETLLVEPAQKSSSVDEACFLVSMIVVLSSIVQALQKQGRQR